jgi:sulfatase modifying factor 1
MVCIPGGPFWRGNDNGKPDEKPRTRIVISPYFMDTYEVDNDQYFKCVEAGKCDPPIKHYVMYTRPKQPVVAVSWFEAYAFCQAVGKRLPTEAEWEKAARGPDGEVYPWGNAPATCDKAVYEEPLGAKGCGTGMTADVGSRPVGRYGLYDMAGNSWEWVDDWKSDCYAGCKGECGADCLGPDPKGPCGGGPKHCPGHGMKVLKGGSWYFTGDRMRGAERRGVSPSNRGPHRLGFRCARSLNP